MTPDSDPPPRTEPLPVRAIHAMGQPRILALRLAHVPLALASLWLAAHWTRFDVLDPSHMAIWMMGRCLAFELFRIPRISWRSFSINDVFLLGLSAVSGSVLGALLLFAQSSVRPTPALLAVDALLYTQLICSGPVLHCALAVERRARQSGTRRRVLICGTDANALSLLETLHAQSRMTREVIGFLDDDSARHQLVIRGLPVLGGSGDISRLVELHQIDEIQIASTPVEERTRETLFENLARAGVPVYCVPTWEEVLRAAQAGTFPSPTR